MSEKQKLHRSKMHTGMYQRQFVRTAQTKRRRMEKRAAFDPVARQWLAKH